MSRKLKKQRRTTNKRSGVKPTTPTQQETQGIENPPASTEATTAYHTHISVTFHFAATVTDELAEHEEERPLLYALLQAKPPESLVKLILGKIIDEYLSVEDEEMYRQILFGEQHKNEDFLAPVLQTLDRKDIVRWDTEDDSEGSVFMEQIREDCIQVELLAMRVQDDKGVQSFTITMQDGEE
jgi:hypothetical protein